MSVFKDPRSKYWQISLVHPFTGARLRRSSRVTSKAEALKIEKMMLMDYERAESSSSRGVTWEQALGYWIVEIQSRHKPITISGNKKRFEFINGQLGRVRLHQISSVMVSDLIINPLIKKKLSKKTINRYTTLVRGVLKLAFRKELIPSVPYIPNFEEKDYEDYRTLTIKEFENLYFFLPIHMRNKFMFALQTGLRDSNIFALKWKHIDMITKKLVLPSEVFKSDKIHAIPLSLDSLNILSQEYGKHPEYVFTYKGKPTGRSSNSAWYTALDRADLKGLRWHDLRHTWATWQREKGIPLDVIQELGGWKADRMVKRYAHANVEHLRKYVT